MQINNLLFEFQYYLDTLNSYYIDNINYLSLITLLLLGFVSGFNPCMLSLWPIYNLYLNKAKSKNEGFFFILGIYIGLFSTLLFYSFIGNPILYNQIGSLLSGVLMVYIGIDQLGIFNRNQQFFRITNFLASTDSVTRYYGIDIFVGMTLGITGSSCSTLTIVTTSLWIKSTHNVQLGLCFIGIYCIGYLIPVYLFNYLIDKIYFQITKFLFNDWITLFNSNMLITIGTIYILGYFNQ